ncbi:MAG: alkaline phosphatase family protein [Actinophytocola sp.]|uniref:alkaline phosphatase family protein n=1 Tax=Actinophytocola sp. TaxID=1872138 RepID=UPI0013298BAD|nr:alkaline phosphatase family protein [Actinophytocola sp.]MPZ84375.1 alkaline phosphatase family protein [Actinophytocola sp.]
MPELPDYGHRSLAEVLPALLAALGAPEPAPALTIGPARAAALLLIDGLGTELLRAHAADAPFLAGLADAGPLTVGFPSSTVISLASLGTGLPPGAHGMLGTSFRVGSEVLDALRWTAGSDDMRDRQPPEEVQPARTVFERAEAMGIDVTVVSKREFRGSGLTRATLRGGAFRGTHALGDLAAEVVTATAAPGRRLVYGYHADLDAMGHVYGPGSLPWRVQLGQVDRLVEAIASRLPADSVLAVTGDHGMITMDRVFDADTDADLREGVLLLGGDPRARHVHAAAGAAADVLATWLGVLGDAAWVVPGEQAIAEGWFGPLAPEFATRIGDVVVAARDDAGVIRSAAEPFISRMVGQHGSLSTAEQLVPLLLARPA